MRDDHRVPLLYNVQAVKEPAHFDLAFKDHADQTKEEVASLALQLEKFRNVHSDLFNKYDALLIEDEAHKVQLDALNTQFIEANLQIGQLKFAQPSSSVSHCSRHPDPEVYNSGGKELSPFIREIRTKFDIKDDCLNCVERPTTRSSMDSTKTVPYFSSAGDIFKLLKQSSASVDGEAAAQADIVNIKQHRKLMIEFLNGWCAKAQLTGSHDKAKIALLKNALHPKLITFSNTSKSHKSPFPTLVSFVALRNVDQVIRSTNPNYTKSSPAAPAAPVLPVTPIFLTTSNSGEAMGLSATAFNHPVWVVKGENTVPANKEERAAHRQFCLANGLCNWCNAKGHKATFCAKASWFD
ncbi:hypothetical protein BJ878DRAFT_577746 [Calycina marina]|uniref:Uncharacterized protein n=1 Tax=Calycina marina TaxID=1763456 RepID=A0A9P7YXX1_9HELO|nr:hypothetical protein BJ878DRAFT_577746 [Calycina marina]